jgi:hypothetical protein
MDHLILLDGETYQKIKDGKIHYLVVKCERMHRIDDRVIIEGTGHEDQMTTHITNVSKEHQKGVQKGYRIINIENK